MSFPTFGLKDLISQMAANYAAAAGLPANVGTGSQLGPIFRAVALAQLLLQNENLYVESIARLSTMQDPLPDGTPNPDVDSFCDQFWPGPGSFRQGAAPSQLYVTVKIPSPSSQDTIVPVGFLFGTVSGPNFAVAAGGTGYNAGANGYVIPAGQTSVDALTQCTNPGTAGNVLANTITAVIVGPNDTPPNAPFTVTNANDYNAGSNIPGIDPEVGSALKTRFALYISGGGEGTPNSILAAVLGVQSGLTVSYGDQVMGTKSGSVWTFTPSTPAWFTIIANVAGQGSAPPQELLDAIKAAIINTVRPAGVAFAVAPPSLVQVAGAGTVVVIPGYDPTATVNAVKQAFADFVNGIGLDLYGSATICSIQDVYIATKVPGVLRIDGLTLNGQNQDVQAAFGSQLVAGVASFSA